MASTTGLQATALQPEVAPGLGAQEAGAATPEPLLSWANGTLSGPLASGLFTPALFTPAPPLPRGGTPPSLSLVLASPRTQHPLRSDSPQDELIRGPFPNKSPRPARGPSSLSCSCLALGRLREAGASEAGAGLGASPVTSSPGGSPSQP